MGWSYRKSVRLGPVRVNFSKSGIGASIGVKGARISTGPRGTQATFSALGTRVTQQLSPAKKKTKKAVTAPIAPPLAAPALAAVPAKKAAPKPATATWPMVGASSGTSSPTRKPELGALFSKLHIPRAKKSPKPGYEKRYREELEGAVDEFRSTIVALITAKPPEPFIFSELAEASGLHPTLTLDVAERLYLTIAGRALADGIITPDEQAKLDWLSGMLEIPTDRALKLTERAGRLKQA